MKKIHPMLIAIVLLGVCLTSCGSNDSNETTAENVKLIISAAASLTDAAEEIKTAFNEKHPTISLTYNFGGSGSLSQQIQQGAPADVFLSASTKDMDTLLENDLVVLDSRFDFVQNELVIVTGESGDIELSTLEDIEQVDVSNIVMGDPKSVPAGRYGKESFENAGVWDKIEAKMVYVSDVRQVLTQVETGNAELGVVYNTDAIQSDLEKIMMKVDSSLHEAIVYPAAVVKSSENKEAAERYLDFLRSDEGKKILQSYGFKTN